jgi:eIF-6 family
VSVWLCASEELAVCACKLGGAAVQETEEIIADVLGVEVFRQSIAGNVLVGSYACFSNQGGVVRATSRARLCTGCRTRLAHHQHQLTPLSVLGSGHPWTAVVKAARWSFWVQVHPQTSVEDLDELSSLLQVPLVAGTCNRGSDVIGAGLIANDWTAFCGLVCISACWLSARLNAVGNVGKIRQATALMPCRPQAWLLKSTSAAVFRTADGCAVVMTLQDTTATEMSVIENILKLRDSQPSKIVSEMRASLVDSMV